MVATCLAKRLWIHLEAERMKPAGDGTAGCCIKLGDRAYTTLGMSYAQERQARAALKRAGAAIADVDHRYESVTVERRSGGWMIVALNLADPERARVRRLVRESMGATDAKASAA
ncbi:MAG: hypothetical protein M3131_09635 [Actinomycetota bacterium]|nr:hypothetical protein [Actinomycetota bacterium]